MFAQKAVLATQQGGCLELIEEDVTGFFIPVNDAKISSRILLELLLNKKKLENAGLAGEKRGRELFSREAFQRNWQRIMK
jgi:glycosyltransferase involved in cell wall biosynthesis